jgi:hypothetical protein
LDDVWVGSFTPVLIEDVIRTYKSQEGNFKNELSGVYKLPRTNNDGGNVYLHLKNFTRWFSLFTTDQPSELVKQFGQSALLDVKVSEEDNRFVLNGFSIDSANQSSYILSTFGGQNPVPFTLKQFVSNRSIMFADYGISNGANFGAGLKTMSSRHAEKDTLAQLAKALNLDFDKLYGDLAGEVGVCWMESKDEATSKVMIIHSTKGIDHWLKTFNTLSDKLSVDTVFHEVYASYEIREVPIFRFPEKIFKPLVSGFDRSYYTSVGNTMLIGEDLEELKRFLDDIDKEETWGKSVAQNKFLEATLLESNVSLYVNAPRVWNVLSNSLHPKWRNFVEQNQSLLNSLGMGAIQFSHLNDSYYTNVSWLYKPANGKSGTTSSERLVTNFTQGVARFFVVKNHADREDEVLVQDSAKMVSLVSPRGKVLWSLQLNDFIAGDVQQVDYFKNGKLQYFFATPGVLHIVDRLGNYVKPYPVSITEKDIEFVSVVDYDHSKKYRFLIAGKAGKLWMFDKEGNNLEGWQPRIVDESLSTAPEHHRVFGKDYLAAIRDDGFVFLMNRRGELLKNFPLDLNARPMGDYYLEIGKGKSSTYFVVVSRDGFRIKFNLDGKIQSREALVKNVPDAQFSLVREKDSKSYLVLRQEAKQLTVFNENLNQLFVSDFVGNNPIDIRYQNFGSGKVYITITDLSQDLSFVYDGKGNMLTSLPIESHAIAVRPSDADKPRVFYNFQRNLTLRPLP